MYVKHHFRMHGFYLLERAHLDFDGWGKKAEAGKIGQVRIKVHGEVFKPEVYVRCMIRHKVRDPYSGDYNPVLKYLVLLESGGTF